MGRPPSLIIVARHGARLDAADAQWHLTSPTPYDPPLTYGGWKQAQALGERIASIVALRQELMHHGSERSRTDDSPELKLRGIRKNRPRKAKIVIHSSPFLRCIQTSIGISAGIELWRGSAESDTNRSHARPSSLHSANPHFKTSPRLTAILEPFERRRNSGTVVERPRDDQRQSQTLLRLDPFLGEWLSPDYFENITPPPTSKMMLASAKAALLREGDPVLAYTVASPNRSTSGNFPGGWSGEELPEVIETSKETTNGPQQISHQVPTITRAQTQDILDRDHLSTRSAAPSVISRSSAASNYKNPVPSYAILPSQPIPQGYVAYARDSCLKIDYQWDSMRPPLAWGTGGEYGEEWSSMHHRFREGFQRMVDFYQTRDSPITNAQKLTASPVVPPPRSASTETSENSEQDTVLVLVTHGAGCNALIGALTNQPVLLDVGTASLTLAVRKDVEYTRIDPAEVLSEETLRAGPKQLHPKVSQEYEIKLTASTDHLRHTPRNSDKSHLISRSSSVKLREMSPYRYERHVTSPTQQPTRMSPIRATFDTTSRTHEDGDFSESLSPRASRATGAIAKGGGLWTPNAKTSQSRSPERRQMAIRIPSHSRQASTTTPRAHSLLASPPITPSSPSDPAPSVGRSLAQNGLWGAEPRALPNQRDQTTPKRRWTLSQAA